MPSTPSKSGFCGRDRGCTCDTHFNSSLATPCDSHRSFRDDEHRRAPTPDSPLVIGHSPNARTSSRKLSINFLLGDLEQQPSALDDASIPRTVSPAPTESFSTNILAQLRDVQTAQNRAPGPWLPTCVPGQGIPPGQSFYPTTDPSSCTYHLDIIQHPIKSAECKDLALTARLPLSPVPVVQLSTKDAYGVSSPADRDAPFLVAHLTLYVITGHGKLEPAQHLAYGTFVSSAHRLRDVNGRLGIMFLFPDVSIRYRGKYVLKFTLVNVMSNVQPPLPGNGPIATNGGMLASAQTYPFDVVPLETFAASPPTPLTQALLRQGVRLCTSTPTRHTPLR